MVDNDAIADVQSLRDHRNIPVDKVGIKAVRHPIIFEDLANTQHAVATINMFVNLASNIKGTHMSRFMELLNAAPLTLSIQGLSTLIDDILTRLESSSAWFEASFDYFVEKKAPVTQVKSLLDYKVTLLGAIENGKATNQVQLVVPVTSLCPCSKKIAQYGAHNQRSHVTLLATLNAPIALRTLIRLIENEASSELFGLLKRPDEKYVTEKAYEKPKFVEDIVRDIAAALNTIPEISAYSIASENFESIHNHSAFAEIRKEK